MARRGSDDEEGSEDDAPGTLGIPLLGGAPSVGVTGPTPDAPSIPGVQHAAPDITPGAGPQHFGISSEAGAPQHAGSGVDPAVGPQHAAPMPSPGGPQHGGSPVVGPGPQHAGTPLEAPGPQHAMTGMGHQPATEPARKSGRNSSRHAGASGVAATPRRLGMLLGGAAAAAALVVGLLIVRNRDDHDKASVGTASAGSTDTLPIRSTNPETSAAATSQPATQPETSEPALTEPASTAAQSLPPSAITVATAAAVPIDASPTSLAAADCTAPEASTTWTGPVTGDVVTNQDCAVQSLAGYWSGDWGKIVIQITDDGSAIAAYDHDAGFIVGHVTDGVLSGTWCESPSYQGNRDSGLVQMRIIETGDVPTIDGRWVYGTDLSAGWREDWDVTGKSAADEPADLLERLPQATARCTDVS